MWNRRYYYREKIKKAACWALIIILLPYIVTVFVNGPKIVTASKVDEMTIDVKGGGKMPVEKYCIGILARDMPAEYEEEALKAQAILVRTEVYRAIRDAGEGQKLEKEFWTEKQMKSAWGMVSAGWMTGAAPVWARMVNSPAVTESGAKFPASRWVW